jgi:hypothetical protein
MHRVLLAALTGASLLVGCADVPAAEPTRSGEGLSRAPQGERFGRAVTEVRLTGSGGVIVVDGADGAGTPIRLTATCGTFVENTEENG